MGRRLARESALQVLFQIDVGKVPVDQALHQVFDEFAVGKSEQDFARELVAGTLKQKQPIDDIITKVAVDWELERMAKVDRNILRIALYEIFYREDVPPSVAVNEAVEMAKNYSTNESGKFVNGVLGKIISAPNEFRPESL